jgi:inner membrane transporter RhtA
MRLPAPFRPALPLLPAGALVAAMLSIQFGGTVAVGLFPHVGAQGATALRLLMGALMLAAVRRPWRVRPSRRVLPALIGYGIVLGAMNLLFYMAIARIPLGIAVALEFSGPLFVAVISSRRLIDLAWTGLALLGLLLLSPFVETRQPLDPAGILLALGAGAGWAAYIVLGQFAGRELGTQTVAIGSVIAAIGVLPFGVACAGPALRQPSVLAGALLLGLFSTALPFTLEMVALTRMPATLYGTLTCVEPAIGALMGLLLLGQHLTAPQMAGLIVVMAAAAGAASSLRKPIASPE